MKNDDNRLDVNFFRKEENLSCPKETDIFDLRTYAEELVKQMIKCDSDGCPLNEENGSCEDDELFKKEFNNLLNKKLNDETLSEENLKRLDGLFDLMNNKSIEESSEPIHDWFGLTYASYLVLPRIFLQEMDKEWQVKFVKLLNELEKEFNDPYDDYLVKPRINKKFVKDITNNYHRGRKGYAEQFKRKNDRNIQKPN